MMLSQAGTVNTVSLLIYTGSLGIALFYDMQAACQWPAAAGQAAGGTARVPVVQY